MAAFVYLELIAGVELRDDGFRFRFPFTLAPAYHVRSRCALVEGEGEMELPAASGLNVQGHVEPEPPASVFAGTPVMLFGEAPDGGRIEIAWDGGGSLGLPVELGGGETGDTIWLLQGARLITDWESRYPSVEALAPLEKRQQSRVAARLRELSRTYGLGSREMSLVAVVKREGDRSGQLPETRVVPVGMPQDTHFGAYFHTPVTMAAAPAGALSSIMRASASMPSAAPPAVTGDRPRFAMFSLSSHRAAPPPTTEDSLLTIASTMDSDGGMPART